MISLLQVTSLFLLTFSGGVARDGQGESKRDQRRRRRDPLNYRPPTEQLQADYSHISIYPRLREIQEEESEIAEKHSLKDSQQAEGISSIDKKLTEQQNGKIKRPSYASTLTSPAQKKNKEIMAMEGRDMTQIDAKAATTGGVAPSSSTLISLSSQPIFKAARKAGHGRKAWAPLDLSIIEVPEIVEPPSVSDAESAEASEAEGSSTSNFPPAATLEVTLYEAQDPKYPQFETASPAQLEDEGKGKSLEAEIELYDNNDWTSKQSLFTLNRRSSTGQLFREELKGHDQYQEETSRTDSPIYTPRDTYSQVLQLDAVMSRIDNAFDVEEWDSPESALALTDANSPEQLTCKPEPVMVYNTVGSLVKSQDPPHFNAPIRIQRDGAGRRPFLGTFSQPRMNEPFLTYAQSCPGPHKMGNMQVAKDSVSTPQYQNQRLNRGSRSGLATVEPIQSRSRGLGPSSTSFGVEEATRLGSFNFQPTASSSPVSSQQTLPSTTLNAESLTGRSSFGQSWVSTRPTLPDGNLSVQSLAGSNNASVQQMTQERSFEHISQNTLHNGGPSSSQPGLDTIVDQDHVNSGGGLLNYEFKFPSFPSVTGDYGMQPPSGFYFQGDTLVRIPGRPEPLKAGPPGGRGVGYQHRPVRNVEQVYPTGQTTVSPHTNHSQSISWERKVHGILLPANPSTRSSSSVNDQPMVKDALSIEAMAKYYPYGLPKGSNAVTGYVEPLSEVEKVQTGSSGLSMFEAEMEDKRHRFTSGIDYLNRTSEDHVDALVDREYARAHGHPPLHPRLRPIGAERPRKTPQEVKAMTDPQCAEHLLGNVFGTMLGYADDIEDNRQPRRLSGWVKVDSRYVDATEEGNKSVFEDREMKTTAVPRMKHSNTTDWSSSTWNKSD